LLRRAALVLGALALLACTVRAAFLAMRRSAPLGLVLLGTFTALVVHSLSYSGFFEDPFAWGIVGLAAAALYLVPAAMPEDVDDAPAGAAVATPEAGAAASRGASA